MNETGNTGYISAETVPPDPAAYAAAYDGLMRAKEAYRKEAHRLARELDAAKEALRPFAELADICDHFRHDDNRSVCKATIKGVPHVPATAGDCRRARAVYGSTKWES